MSALNRGLLHRGRGFALIGFGVATHWLLQRSRASARLALLLRLRPDRHRHLAGLRLTSRSTTPSTATARCARSPSRARRGPRPTSSRAWRWRSSARPSEPFVISLAIVGSYQIGNAVGIPGPDSSGRRSPPWACSRPRPTSSPWTPSGRITDNAGGIVRDDHQPDDVARRPTAWTRFGNTTCPWWRPPSRRVRRRGCRPRCRSGTTPRSRARSRRSGGPCTRAPPPCP